MCPIGAERDVGDEQTIFEPRQEEAEVRPLLSHTTILILSTFLIGMVAGRAAGETTGSHLLLIGIFGVIAYFGLGLLARARAYRAARLASERASSELEHRIDRHIPQRSLIRRGPAQPTHACDERQYLTVARSHASQLRRAR